MMLFQGTITTP